MDDNHQAEPSGLTQPKSGSRNIFHIIWQGRALVMLGLVVGLTIGVLTYMQRTPIYRAGTQVLVVRKQSNPLPVAGGDPRMAAMEDYVGTHLAVIKSPLIVGMAVKKRNLNELPSLQGSNPVGVILSGLIATRDNNKDGPSGGGNSILNLSYSGTNPGDVEVILSAIVESYKDFLDETYQNTSETTVGLILSAKKTLTESLEKKEEEYRKFRRENPLLIVSENGVPFHQSKILEYQKKETENREQVAAIEKRIAEVEKAIEENQPKEFILALAEQKYERGNTSQNTKIGASQQSNTQAMESALFALLQQETELKQFYGDDHPEVVRIAQRIKKTREFHLRLDEIARNSEGLPKVADPVQNALYGLKVEYRLAIANHKWIKGLLDEELKNAQKSESQYETDKGFREGIGRTQKVLDSTLKRLEEINLIRGYGGFDAKTITPPAAGSKIAPLLWQFILMGAVLGMGLGAGTTYLLDLADKSFRTPEEIRRRLGLPIFGHVPFFSMPSEPVSTLDGAGNTVELESNLLALHQPTSAAAEGIRGVRTALYFSTHAQRHKVIQVTSPNMGDGKTTLITNLAVSIAQSGRKVLLIDADLRRPRIHRVFGMTAKIGLAEVIAGSAELDEAIQVTVVPNLTVLPCGRRPQNPAELLSSPRFEDLIDDIRGAFDYILIDSPPLLAVSDPCIIAPRVDGLLLALRLFKYGRPTAERARDILFGLKVNCMGVVVNGVGKQGLISGYGYDHYKYGGSYSNKYYKPYVDGESDIPPEPFPSATDSDNAVKPSDSTEKRPETPSPAIPVEPSANGHSKAPQLGDGAV